LILRKVLLTEAALLRLIRVKCRLLGLHPLYQFLDPVKRSLIGDSGHQTAVMLDLAVQFDAPERVAGLSCQSAGLRQPSVEFFALSEIHFPCSCQVDGGIAKMFTELLSQR
jgi:hypothetical protein